MVAGDTIPLSLPKLCIHGDRGLIPPEQTPTKQLNAWRRSHLGHVEPKTRRAPSKVSVAITVRLWIRIRFPLETASLKVAVSACAPRERLPVRPSAGGEVQHEQTPASSRVLLLFPPSQGLSALFCGSRKNLTPLRFSSL